MGNLHWICITIHWANTDPCISQKCRFSADGKNKSCLVRIVLDLSLRLFQSWFLVCFSFFFALVWWQLLHILCTSHVTLSLLEKFPAALFLLKFWHDVVTIFESSHPSSENRQNCRRRTLFHIEKCPHSVLIKTYLSRIRARNACIRYRHSRPSVKHVLGVQEWF